MNNENQTEQASVSVGRDVKDGVAVAGHDNITNVTMNITQSPPEKPDAPKPDDTRFLFPNYIIILALIGLSVWWGFSIQNKLKPFEEKTYGIIVTQFKGNTDAQKNKGKEIQASIQSTLNARFKELGINDADARNSSLLIESHEVAREYGKKYKAELVIWGDVTLQGIIPNITIINEKSDASKLMKPETALLKDSLCHAALAKMNDIRFPALTDEPTKLVSFVTAVKHKKNKKNEMAIEYFILSLPEQLTNYIDSSIILFEIGEVWSDMREYSKAIEYYNQAIKINPKYDLAYSGRGYAYWGKLEYDKAIEDYTKTIEINPKFDCAYIQRGRIYEEKSEYDKAISEYNQAIQVDPKDSWAYTELGNIYRKKGEYDKGNDEYNKAINYYTKQIQINPKEAWIYNNRGNIYIGKGEYDKAIEDYTQAILKSESDCLCQYHNRRGNAYEKKGEYDKAFEDYNKAIEINPKFVEAYKGMSWLLATCPDEKYRNGEKAIEFAKKATELEPKDFAFWDTLAAAYAEAGKFEDAVKTQEKAIEMLNEKDKAKKLSEYTERLNFYKANKPWREKKEPK